MGSCIIDVSNILATVIPNTRRDVYEPLTKLGDPTEPVDPTEPEDPASAY